MANPIVTYINEALQEARKVAWPTKHEIIQHTSIVVGLSIFLAAFLGLVDYFLNLGLQELLLRR